jgi:hypothetical protein
MTTDDKIVELGVEPPPAPPPSAPGRLHGIAITGMALFALIGIFAMFLLATVQWTDTTRGYVIATMVIAGIGFIVFAAAAVLFAARDTYPRHPSGGDSSQG